MTSDDGGLDISAGCFRASFHCGGGYEDGSALLVRRGGSLDRGASSQGGRCFVLDRPFTSQQLKQPS